MSAENRIVSQELIGNPVIDITDGERIAKVEGVQIDPDTLQAAAIVTTKGGLLNRERKGIPAGQDAAEAMAKLQQRDVRQLPVMLMRNSSLVGLLRRRDLFKWLQLHSEGELP